MSKYETAIAAMSARRINVASEPTKITMAAAEARKLANGRPYVTWGAQAIGICRGCEFLPRASDATPKAVVTIGAPESDAERAALVAAIIEYMTRSPGVSGSAHDPMYAAEWAEYRRVMAELRA